MLSTALLSLMGSCMIVQSWVLHSKGKGISNIVLYLGLSDVGWSLMDVITFSVYIHDHRAYKAADLCFWSRVVYQFFSCAAVMWTTSISIFLYRKFVVARRRDSIVEGLRPLSVRIKKHKSIILYHLMSWGVPLIQAVLLYNHIERTDQDMCFPRAPYFILFFFLPICIAIAGCVIVYILFIRALVKNASYTLENVVVQIPFRLALYVLALLVCWLPVIVVYSISPSISPQVLNSLFEVVNAIMGLLGLMDCFVYGLTNKEFRKHYAGVQGILLGIFSPVTLPSSIILIIYSKLRGKSRFQADDSSDTLPFLPNSGVISTTRI